MRKFGKSAVLLVALGLFALFLSALAQPAVAAEQVTWRFGQQLPVDSDFQALAESFVAKVAERTEGRVKIDIYPAKQLGDWTETFEMISRGSLESGIQQPNANFDPKLNFAYYFPYLITDLPEAKRAFGKDGWAYKIILDLWATHNIKALAVLPIGMCGTSLRKIPDSYAEPGVAKGMKVRVMPIKPCEWTYEALGYIVTPIPATEVYTAIQTGVADGRMGSPPYEYWYFRDVQKAWVQYNDYFETHWIVVNMDTWNKLTPEDQKVVLEAALEESDKRWKTVEYEDEFYRKKLADEAGWDVRVLTPEQLANIAAYVRKTVWPKMEGIVGKELMDVVYKESGIPRQ